MAFTSPIRFILGILMYAFNLSGSRMFWSYAIPSCAIDGFCSIILWRIASSLHIHILRCISLQCHFFMTSGAYVLWCIYACRYVYVCMCVYVSVCIYVYMYMYVYIYMYIYFFTTVLIRICDCWLQFTRLIFLGWFRSPSSHLAFGRC